MNAIDNLMAAAAEDASDSALYSGLRDLPPEQIQATMRSVLALANVMAEVTSGDGLKRILQHPVEAKLVEESLDKLPDDVWEDVVRAYRYSREATEGSAGIDLRYCGSEPLVLQPGEQALVGTGLAIHLNSPNLVGICAPRSGRGNAGLVLGNTIGVIDEDYQGELKLSLLNRLPSRILVTEDGWRKEQNAIVIQPGERVAQYFVVRREVMALTFVDAFGQTTERGDGGFGHSGNG